RELLAAGHALVGRAILLDPPGRRLEGEWDVIAVEDDRPLAFHVAGLDPGQFLLPTHGLDGLVEDRSGRRLVGLCGPAPHQHDHDRPTHHAVHGFASRRWSGATRLFDPFGISFPSPSGGKGFGTSFADPGALFGPVPPACRDAPTRITRRSNG